MVLAVGAAGEFLPIVALSIVLAVASGELWRTVLLLVFAVIVVAAGLLTTHARPARVVRLIDATMHSSGQLALRLALLLLGGLVAIAGSLGLDVVLGAFAAGFIIGLITRTPSARDFRVKLDAVGYGFLIPIFFISTGLGFDLDSLVDDPGSMLLVPFFAAAVPARPRAARVPARRATSCRAASGPRSRSWPPRRCRWSSRSRRSRPPTARSRRTTPPRSSAPRCCRCCCSRSSGWRCVRRSPADR